MKDKVLIPECTAKPKNDGTQKSVYPFPYSF